MKTWFSRLALSLFVLLVVSLVSPVHAKAYKVTYFNVYRTSAGNVEGYVITGANSSQCCIFFLRGNGPDGAAHIMALATALQMNQTVAWFYGTSGSGQWGDFEDVDSGEDIHTIELYKDPATLPANVQHATPFDLYVSSTQLHWSATCKPGFGVNCKSGGYPGSGYSGGWYNPPYLLTHGQWFTYIGSVATSTQVGALGAVFSGFSGQYGVEVLITNYTQGIDSIRSYSPYFSP